nr:MAG TPA: hypothetical protein [Caudoviricetes sp.]
MSVWQGELKTSSRSAREARRKRGSVDGPEVSHPALPGGESGVCGRRLTFIFHCPCLISESGTSWRHGM